MGFLKLLGVFMLGVVPLLSFCLWCWITGETYMKEGYQIPIFFGLLMISAALICHFSDLVLRP